MSANRAGLPRRESGQGMVEFALILPLLLVFIFGIIEFGRLLFVYSAVLTASREAARYGSAAGMGDNGELRYMDCVGMEASARRVGVLANITAVDISYDAGPGTASLPEDCNTLSQDDITGGRHRVVVQVTVNYQPILPLIRMGSFNLASTSARTIYNNIIVGRTVQYPIHISDLDSSAEPSGGKWKAVVAIRVMDEEGNPVDGAIVRGEWSWNGGENIPPDKTCTTGIDGWCLQPLAKNKINHSTITLEIIDIYHPEKTYDSTANTEPDPSTDDLIVKTESIIYGIRIDEDNIYP